jgi:hypothetical protein
MQTGISEMRALRSFLDAAVASRGAPEKREVHNWPEKTAGTVCFASEHVGNSYL